MAGSFRIAEGFVEVTADESGYDRAMQRLRAKKNKVGITLELDDSAALAKLRQFADQHARTVLKAVIDADLSASAARRVSQQLDRLTADRVVNIRATVDTRVAAEELRNLTQRRRVRLGVDVDTRVAADELANLTRRRQVRVVADVDTAAAAARLAALTRTRTVNVRVDGAGAGAASVGLLSTRLAGLAAMALSALPTVASLASSIAQMGPAAAVAVPALGSLVTMGATLAVGLHGIGNAFQAAFSSGTKGAASTAAAGRALEAAHLNVARAARALKEAEADAARQIVDAQKRVKDAVEDVRDAEVQAAADRKAALQRVADAERALAEAQKDARKAQEDLTEARKKAAEELEDLNNRLADAELDQRQAVLDLRDAEENLAAVKAKGSAATAEELEQAQLGYDRANQRLKEQQTETARLREETAAANEAGVQGSETVQAAQDKVADSQRNVSDRTRDVRDAQAEAAKVAKDGAESVRDAQERLAEAQQGVADAQVAAARQVRAAQESLADAQRSVNTAQAQGAAQTDKFAEAMAKLSPNAREFVNSIRRLGPAFSDLRMEVQDRLFRGLGDSVSRMASAALPALRSGLGGMADVLNGMARNLMDTFTRLADQGLLKRMFDGFTNGMKPLEKIPGQLGQAFVQLSIAAAPAFERITKAMAGSADRISQKLTDAFESGRLQEAIDHGIDMAKRFGRLLADAFGTLKNIFGAASAGGADALTTLGDAFKELRRVTGLPEMQDSLRRIFRAFHEIASLVTSVVGAALAGLLPILAPFADAIASIAENVKGPLTSFFQFVGEHSTIFGALATAVLSIAAGMKLWALGTAAVATAQAILSTVMAASPFTWIALAVIGLAGAFAYAWHESETFRDIVTGVWDAVKTAFSATLDWIKEYIVEPFQWLYDKLVGHSIIPDLVRGIIGWFTSLWTKTKEIFTGLKSWLVDTWKNLWGSIRARWDSFWSGLKSAVSGAWKWVRDSVSGLRTAISGTWNGLWNGARDKISSIFTTIRSKISDFKAAMKLAFSTLRDSLGTIWNGVKSKIASPVKFVVGTVYNNGIRRMWNSIAGKISSSITLPTISLGFSTGGVVPGQRSNRDSVPAMLAPGERVLSNTEVDRLGGYRAIDAMLGKDRPTGTGGNPTSTQERKRRQPVPGFADGGIIGTVTDAIGGTVGSIASWAKDVVVGGLKSAARKALSALVRPLINRIPQSGIGNLMRGLANKAVDGMLGWFGNEDKKAVGGPAVQRGLSWAKTQNGKPYQWGGNGNPSWDCSGLVSAIESVIRGESPHRRWATGAFSGTSGPSGWVRNLNSPYMIGITNAGVGHTAGTIGGVNVESRGGDGVIIGRGARGYNDSLFTSRWGYAPATKYDAGGLLAKGATLAINKTREPERILTPAQNALFEELVRGGRGGAVTIERLEVNIDGTLDLTNRQALQRLANSMPGYMNEALRKWNKERAR
ncbi:hypothetical protein F7R91_05590 [Streptomyces luteolifulvus]|uniref:Uncharacterized protein n=1 Tax=Streptomyces luteolifulvus TaxID=2615112 RepID=A0A6H9V877_9ACTN|nr:hypothetical protein [Streptomyces luteolifulvus]KAB1149231.1 hypothetical protein F7R91_05590 [Streptomyces luteolifulvus]